MRLIALLMCAAAALLLPGGAGAKFTCEDRGRPVEGIDVRGLPARPIAGRMYTLTVGLPAGEAANRRPYLGAEPCGERTGREPVGVADGWFRRVGDRRRGLFSLSIRFPYPGRWALSFMGRDGSFHDLGLRSVRPEPTSPAAASDRAETARAKAACSRGERSERPKSRRSESASPSP